MRVSIYLSDGGELAMDHMDDASALDFREEVAKGDDQFLSLDMDGATVLVAVAHIVRIDFD